MPSVYDYHHVELDSIGRGKRRISAYSVDGGVKDLFSTSFGSLSSSPEGSLCGSRPQSRRGSRTDDTKNRLFGPVQETTPRRIRDNLKSTVFSNLTSPSPNSSPVKVTPKKIGPATRNPITGDLKDIKSVVNSSPPVTPYKKDVKNSSSKNEVTKSDVHKSEVKSTVSSSGCSTASSASSGGCRSPALSESSEIEIKHERHASCSTLSINTASSLQSLPSN